eukprot:CAMPEP_0198602554 /NCGR_PEP_ID=MMETSP1462-20131121/150856_1 /TAXON_ID=1333877 /ORGANISM="Brandtodinium nutriculum, Strain RCC3387" /LENGTH=68 /DNA_ID=CAMNT_0044334315 /DNA_START=38 /DNA_END=241 /DNA_ORIENTATION=-
MPEKASSVSAPNPTSWILSKWASGKVSEWTSMSLSRHTTAYGFACKHSRACNHLFKMLTTPSTAPSPA